jgi:hypothetical protein
MRGLREFGLTERGIADALRGSVQYTDRELLSKIGRGSKE